MLPVAHYGQLYSITKQTNGYTQNFTSIVLTYKEGREEFRGWVDEKYVSFLKTSDYRQKSFTISKKSTTLDRMFNLNATNVIIVSKNNEIYIYVLICWYTVF